MFGGQCLFELWIRFLWLEQERCELEPATHSIVDIAELRFVIAGDDRLELRHVGEEVAAHVASGDRFAAGQFLNAPFVPGSAFVGFGGEHQARAA